jgi:hypothetical protein
MKTRRKLMNQAQLNQRIVDDALRDHREARLARAAVITKVATWFPEGGHEAWAEECFKRLWLSYHDNEGLTATFKDTLCDVLSVRFPGYSSRDDVTRGNFNLMGMVGWRHGYRRELNVRLPLEDRRFAVSRTDDEFEELIEDWIRAVKVARGLDVRENTPMIGEWIWAGFDAIDWHSRDKAYWVNTFAFVNKNTSVPPKGYRGRTVRRKKWSWPIFRQLITDRVKSSLRHIPRGWYDDEKPPRTAAVWLKRVRFIVRVVKDAPGAARGNSSIDDYGEQIGRMINGFMTRMAKDIDDPCMDNFRFAALDKPGDMRRYRDRRASGCCGSSDNIVMIHGRKFIIGCNYGH